MKLLTLIASELFGLLVDDPVLAVGILVVVAGAWVLSVTLSGLAAGALLIGGSLVVLAWSVARGARR